MDTSYDSLDLLVDMPPLSKLMKPSDMIAKEKETIAKPAGKKVPVEEDTPSQKKQSCSKAEADRKASS